MAHTTERAILVLCAHPSLATEVQAFTADAAADAEEYDEDFDEGDETNFSALRAGYELLKRFPAEVQQAATMRVIIAPRRFTVLSSIRQVRFRPPTPPPSQLLSLLAISTPDDLVRVILEFVGVEVEETTEQKLSRLKRVEKRNMELRRENEKQRGESEEQKKENEEQKKEIEDLKRQIEEQRKESGMKRGRED